MAAKSGQDPFKREFSSVGGVEVSTTCSPRKKRRLNEKDDSSVRNEFAIVEVSRRV